LRTEKALHAKPDVLVIDTGNAGVMRVPKETFDRIVSQGIEVKVERTSKTVKAYNELHGAKTRVDEKATSTPAT